MTPVICNAQINREFTGRNAKASVSVDSGVVNTQPFNKKQNKSNARIDSLKSVVQTKTDSVNQMVNKYNEVKSSKGIYLNKADSVQNQVANGFTNIPSREGLIIYSEKYKKRLYDSLGLKKADSLFNAISTFKKKEVQKEDLIRSINSSFPSQQNVSEDGINNEIEKVKADGGNALNGLPKNLNTSDLSKVKLPDETLSELAPIRSRIVDNHYMKIVDSMRQINLHRENLKMKEQKVSQGVKTTILKEKESFIRKSYIEGVIGYLQTDKFTIFQASPSIGYHFTNYLSIGIGPNILINYQDKKTTTTIGVRYFSKIEFLKRRGYFQLEDNLMPTVANTEYLKKAGHSVLIGGGTLLPISKSIGITPSLMYRINNGDQGSPWVFRLGISSIKSK